MVELSMCTWRDKEAWLMSLGSKADGERGERGELVWRKVRCRVSGSDDGA
jgi:hypothetical protein